MRTLYVKMKTENGTSVYRNIAPQTATNKLSFALSNSTVGTASRAANLVNYFVPIQTEQPDMKDGKFQLKIVDEWTFDFAEETPVTLPGTDAWTDTTDEKLLTSFTDGDKTYQVKLAHAASAMNPAASGQYIPAVRDYASQIASEYRTADVIDTVDAYEVDWTEVHLTGTRDSLVARPD